MALDQAIKQALNEIRFPTPTGIYIGPRLGDLIEQAIQEDPISVLGGPEDPSAGAGIAASPGDLFRRDAAGPDGGELWVKVGDADTAWELVNTAAGDNLGNHIMTQDLHVDGFDFTTDEVDGASAVGHTFKTDNELVTEGSKLFRILNQNAEYFAVRHGEDSYGYAFSSLFEFNTISGNTVLSVSVEDETFNQIDLSTFDAQPDTWFVGVDDPNYGPGWNGVFLTFSLGNYGPAPEAALAVERDGDGFSELKLHHDEARFRVNDQSGATSTQTTYVMFTRPTSGFNSEVGAELTHKWSVKSGLIQDRLALSSEGILYGGSGEAGSAYSDWELRSVARNAADTNAFILDTVNDITQSAARLLSVRNLTSEKFSLDKDGSLYIQGTQILTTQQGAISDASGGATIDTEARAAINALLAAMRIHGIINT